MAHELEITADGNTSFAYSKQHGSPWHHLGTPIDGLSTVEEILVACRGDYEVHKATLMTPEPMIDVSGATVINNAKLLDTGKHYTWRTRPIFIDQETGIPGGGDAQVLGVVGKDYTIVNNDKVGELARQLAGALPGEAAVDCAGVLNDGRRFFMTIPLPDVVLDPDGAADLHVRNLVVTTGHDGNWALQMVNSTVRAVCANTVTAALNQRRWAVSIRHSAGAANIDQGTVKRALGLTEVAGDEFRRLGEVLLSLPATMDTVKLVHDGIWGKDLTADTDRKRTTRATRMAKLEVLWNSETNTGAVGANRWAALNTFSEYFEHQASFSGMKAANARAIRATEGKGLNNRVNEVSQLLQSI